LVTLIVTLFPFIIPSLPTEIGEILAIEPNVLKEAEFVLLEEFGSWIMMKDYKKDYKSIIK
jgi:hypothetical protein